MSKLRSWIVFCFIPHFTLRLFVCQQREIALQCMLPKPITKNRLLLLIDATCTELQRLSYSLIHFTEWKYLYHDGVAWWTISQRLESEGEDSLSPKTNWLCPYVFRPKTGHIHKDRIKGWLPEGVVAQCQSIGTESQRPWVQVPVAVYSKEQLLELQLHKSQVCSNYTSNDEVCWNPLNRI